MREYRCPKCGYFLIETQWRAEGTVRAFCRGKCRKFRTIRLADGSLVGEQAPASRLPLLTAAAA